MLPSCPQDQEAQRHPCWIWRSENGPLLAPPPAPAPETPGIQGWEGDFLAINSNNLRYQVEASFDLLEWQNVPTLPTIRNIDDPWRVVTVQYSVTARDAPRRFLRVLIE